MVTAAPGPPPWKHGPLAGNDRGLDWIFDRTVECATPEQSGAASAAAWAAQREHLGEHSGFYRSKLGAALRTVTLDDLADVPFTTKDELRRAQDHHPPFGNHLAVDASAVKRVYQTSGTSGHPSVIALTTEDVATWSTIGSRSYYATGIRPHNSVLSTFGAGPFVAGHIHGVIHALDARSVPVGPGDTARVLATLERGLVDTFLTTPSFALYLADRLDRDGIDPGRYGLIHLITGGEPGGGLPAIRRRLEASFGAAVTEAMGLGDISPSLFGECPAQRGMHFGGGGLVWPELVDEQGRVMAIEPGATGELVYTHLRRQAMPLVRFRSGDWVQIVTTACECGRTSFTIRIAGRVDDMFIVRGVNVYPSAVQAIVAEFVPAVTGRARILLPSGAVSVEPPVPVEVEVPDGSGPTERLMADIEAALRSRLTFRAEARPVPSTVFGDAGYKTRPVTRGRPPDPD